MRFFLFLVFPFSFSAQVFTKQDTLLGSNTPERAWWNLTKYELQIEPEFATKSLKGSNAISFVPTGKQTSLQIDLRNPLQIDSVIMSQKKLSFKRDGEVYLIELADKLTLNQRYSLTVFFSGKPQVAVKPPWDGGFIWKLDEQSRPWMSVACQGIGASVWFPCKDYPADEPENGSEFTMIVPQDLEAVSNGRLVKTEILKNGKKATTWKVVNPINHYNITPYIGHYVNWTEEFQGEKGKLDCSYWVLDYELEKAKKQFKQAPVMLTCFEKWFGPYPFYEDGYKLIQSPYLGMEHQSGIAYGNGFENGYYGKDLSGTGWGLLWDFIIVHESGHEWFGNNISIKDVADMWIHESFTNYSETIFTECLSGKQAANEYVVGIRKNIANDIPIIGKYNVRNEGSGDMYYKGGNLVHLIRQLMEDDEKFRLMLREMNNRFYHQTVTTEQIESFIMEFSGLKLDKIFDQYLRTNQIPTLEYCFKKGKLNYRWTTCVPYFDLKVKTSDGVWLEVNESWKVAEKVKKTKHFKIDSAFYIQTIQVKR